MAEAILPVADRAAQQYRAEARRLRRLAYEAAADGDFAESDRLRDLASAAERAAEAEKKPKELMP